MEDSSTWEKLVEKLWLRQIDESRYALVRIGFSIVAFLNLCSLWPYRHSFFSSEGIISQMAAISEIQVFYPSVFGIIESPAAVTGYFIFSGLAIICLGLGRMPRLAAFFVFLWIMSFTFRAPISTTGWDLVLRCFSFLILVSPLGKSWKFPGSWRPATRLVPVYGITLMRIQVLIIYWQTVIARFHDPFWQNGDFFAYFLLSHHSRWPGQWVIDALPLMRFFTWSTQGLEILLPVLLLIRKTRWIGIVLGCLFHLAIVIVSNNVSLFSLTMVMTYLAFLRQEDVLRFRPRLNVKAQE